MDVLAPPKTTTCPSCSAEVEGKFCQNCGQKQTTGRDLTVKHFLKEAYSELFDLDSKFLRTLRALFLQPGLLANEFLAGKQNLYIRPFRLYMTLVVLHFLLFGLSKQGDIFDVERLPFIQISPLLPGELAVNETRSGLSHQQFVSEVNGKFKDNLSILMYMVVFAAAGVFQLLYVRTGKYYVEHLWFMFYLFSFSLARNIAVIPLLILGLTKLTIFIVITSQLLYSFFAIRNVYREHGTFTVTKLAVFSASIVAMFFVSVHLAVYASLLQLNY